MGVGVWKQAAVETAGIPSTSGEGHSNQLVYDPTEDLVLLYGNTGKTSVWDGTSWTQVATTPNVGEPVVWFDENSGLITMFSGDVTVTFNNTYTWDWAGSSWTLLAPSTKPAAREGAGIAYDQANGEAVMFGGVVGGTTAPFAVAQTYTWNGTNWTLKTPATVPTARFRTSMAYDPVRGQVVMFSGRSVTNTFLTDTWTWDGTDWTLASPSTVPVGREYAGMCWDPVIGKVLMYGGFAQPPVGGGYFSDETWVYGTDWSDLTSTVNDPGAPPLANEQLGLCYFASRREVTMIASDTSGATTQGDTWVIHHARRPQMIRWR